MQEFRFDSAPPDWTGSAVHAKEFCCPTCGAPNKSAQAVWINRRSPVYTEDHRRKWQEFYQCGGCATVWWAWSSDRPPSELAKQERDVPPPPRRFYDPFDDL